MRPSDLPLNFLEEITNEFSKDRILGSGGYGKVYKGIDKNGREIAVKKLYDLVPGFDDEQFTNEFNSLMKVRHQNIVRLVGYCYEKRHKVHKHNGESFLCTIIDRVLCLEYVPGGSLDKHLNDESCGHDWPTRFKIIKGICEGLTYLHGNTPEDSIFHLDLKPANILLDKNMIPKIADFGLSRLFGGTHTHITRNCAGTEAYMPPEYLLKRQISEKYDVFSLGVTIIDIITGQGGYSKYGDMTSEKFIEHVSKKWMERIELTSRYTSLEEDRHQVQTCIDLALRCVDADRHKRPSVKDIVTELKWIERNDSASPRDKVRLAKIGQWGGVGGNFCDTKEAPCRLKTLIIGSGDIIYSLEFSYDDHDGKEHTTGPWGGWGPNGHGNSRHTINLGPSEVITEVSGTTGRVDFAQGAVKSLTIITTASRYGPFGEVTGTPFQIPVLSNGSIVGFFARTGWCIDALGVYVKPKHETEGSGHAKIGPWGGSRGQVHDIEVAPKRLESVTICSGTVIDSLAFSYRDQDGHYRSAGPWGGFGESAYTATIRLGHLEFLTGLHGTTGPFAPASADGVVTSLTLVTNVRSYGPFGEGGGSPFKIPMWCKGSIVGFFGRAESYVNAIGIYANPVQEAMQEQLVCSLEPGLSKIGPWGRGGDIGSVRDINIEAGLYRLVSITVSYGTVINSFSFSYIDFKEKKHDVGPWGTPSGETYKIVFHPLELVNGVSGTVGSYDSASTNVITSLSFVTGRHLYGPIGAEGGTPFSFAAEEGGCVVGFFGRAGTCLEALGFYVHRY